MNYQLLTNHYYSLWLGETEVLCHKNHGIHFIYSNERNAVQYGYSAQFDLYAFCQNDRIIVSYGDKAADKNQCEGCGCFESIDIGAYNTCLNGCVYCYANESSATTTRRHASHNPESGILIGSVLDGEKITQRKVKSDKQGQITLF